jgi:hypothetical protein
MTAKSNLRGYCAAHGTDPLQVFRADGKMVWNGRFDAPADHPAVRRNCMKAHDMEKRVIGPEDFDEDEDDDADTIIGCPECGAGPYDQHDAECIYNDCEDL